RKKSPMTGRITLKAAAPRPLLSALLVAADGSITAITLSNGQARVTFDSVPGTAYQIQRTDSLTPCLWLDTGTAITAVTTSTEAAVYTDSENDYYRVLEFSGDVFWYHWNYYFQDPWLTTWGMGSSQTAYTHLDRTYDWYIDQGNTGPASNKNCGPSTTVMAIKWYDGSYTGTVEEARDWSYDSAGNDWWYTNHMIDYLNLNSIPFNVYAFTGPEQIETLISEGKIILLCINASYLTYNSASEERIGSFYDNVTGHFLLVKGCRQVSGNVYFEVYDSNTLNRYYSDGTSKGRNRHLSAADITAANTIWWNKVLAIDPPSTSVTANAMRASSKYVPLAPDEIDHMWGQ
ncbi:MAG: hypothetical protein K9M45_12130, partial [Kiritimatiellales bacterium]|nr:hypothetical protein [Kiritimatiellales bacterium]